jgi:glycosidase
MPVRYKMWLKYLTDWCKEEKFSLALESHDTPRAATRFHADPRVLAMLQFLLPNNYPCIYNGQEIGTKNPQLSNNINDYPGVQSRMMYRTLRKEGKTKKQAMAAVRFASRDNARQPIDWGEYITQSHSEHSTLNMYRKVIALWKNDPVIIHGKLKVKRITNQGVIDFYRIFNGKKYFIHLDMSNKTVSYVQNDEGVKFIRSR